MADGASLIHSMASAPPFVSGLLVLCDLDMDLDDLLDEGFFRGILRILLGFLRGLHYIGWHLCFEVIGWIIGWPIYRLLTFGMFPKEGLKNHEAAPWFTSTLVELTGFGLLTMLIIWLSQYA